MYSPLGLRRIKKKNMTIFILGATVILTIFFSRAYYDHLMLNRAESRQTDVIISRDSLSNKTESDLSRAEKLNRTIRDLEYVTKLQYHKNESVATSDCAFRHCNLNEVENELRLHIDSLAAELVA